MVAIANWTCILVMSLFTWCLRVTHSFIFIIGILLLSVTTIYIPAILIIYIWEYFTFISIVWLLLMMLQLIIPLIIITVHLCWKDVIDLKLTVLLLLCSLRLLVNYRLCETFCQEHVNDIVPGDILRHFNHSTFNFLIRKSYLTAVLEVLISGL